MSEQGQESASTKKPQQAKATPKVAKASPKAPGEQKGQRPPQAGAQQAAPKGGPKVDKVAPPPRQKSAQELAYVPRVLTRYKEKVVPALISEFGYKNPMQVPRLEKVVLNMGFGKRALSGGTHDAKPGEAAVKDLREIGGQQPVITKAKKAIANFHTRKGMAVGAMVTLRGRRMYDFMDRLVNAALPRIRDFRGVSEKAFDGSGNYSLGIQEHPIFPEITFDQVDRARSMQVNIITTAPTNAEGKRLLELLGMPFPRQRGGATPAVK